MDFFQTIEDMINQQKWGEALSYLQQGKAEYGTQSEFFNIQAIILYYLGHLEEAQQSAEKAIELDETNLDAHKNLVDILKKRLNQTDTAEMIVYDTQGKTVPQAGNSLYESRENVMQTITNDKGPLVDIVVLGYNRLEKTKRCVNSILDYTKGIDYQLLLVNSGSSDETLSFFQSVIHPRKRIIHITRNIGSMFAQMSAVPFMKAPYRVYVANDVYVTANWLTNLLRCAQSCPDVGMICPMSSNTSNLQDPGLTFSGFDDMQRKAAVFNHSDPRKWEERMRLVTPCTFYTKIAMDIVGMPDYGFFHDFSDDDYAFRIRRSGYKTILCADTFVCHDHDVFHGEGKDAKTFQKSIEIGRDNFSTKHFVDAWTDAGNFERSLISTLDAVPQPDRIPKILGIDVACGTPLLELKNHFRRLGVFDIPLFAYTADAKYFMDLKTICAGGVKFGSPKEIEDAFDSQKFDCILIGKSINTYEEPYRFLKKVAAMLKPSGRLLMKLQNTGDLPVFLQLLGLCSYKRESNLCEMQPDELIGALKQMGLKLDKAGTENYKTDSNLMAQIKNIFKNAPGTMNRSQTMKKLLVQCYDFNFVNQ